MEKFEIQRADAENIDFFNPLWDKLRYHHALSVDFKERFENMTWERRKHNIPANTVEMLLDYAIDKSTAIVLGALIGIAGYFLK